MAKLELSRGYEALVDDDQVERLSKDRWCVNFSRKGGKPYAKRSRDHARLSRVILGMDRSDKRVADHINGDTLDNRRTNLRACTIQENTWNSAGRSGRVSKAKGVTRERNKWRADIWNNGRKYCLGVYESRRKAAAVYRRVERRLRGEFAREL